MKTSATFTRRKLAGLLASSASLAPLAAAQTAAPADPLQAAQARIKANTDMLAKQQVPMATEPAFQFKA